MKIRCEYCQSMVDVQASACPFCGGPLPEAPRQTTSASSQASPGKPPIAILLALVLILGLSSYLLSRAITSPARAASSIAAAMDQVNAATADGPTYQTVIDYHLENGSFEAAHRTARKMLEHTDAAEYGPWCVERFTSFGRRDFAASLAIAADVLCGKRNLLPLVAEVPLAELLPASPLRQAMELATGMTAEHITLEQIQTVTSLSIRSPDLLTKAQEISIAFDGGIPVTLVVEGSQDGRELGLIYFQGLQQLKAAVRGLAPEDLLLPELLELTLPAGIQSTDLSGYARLPKLERLYVGGSSLSSLDGLDKLPSLRSLTLYNTGITNLSVLSGQRQITELGLLANKHLSSVASLSMADHLEGLSLSGSALTDLSPLASLHNLTSLSIDRTSIRDTAFLAGMTSLEELTLTGNDSLDSVPELANLPALKRLTLESDELFVSPSDIAARTSLRSLKIRMTRDFSYLHPLEGLEELSVCSYRSTLNLTSLRQLANLRRLNLHCGWFADTYTTSLEGLEGLSGLPLEQLSLRDKSIYGPLDAVLELSTLQSLDLSGSDSKGTDYRKLSNLKQLRELNLNGYRDMHDLPPEPGQQHWTYKAGPAAAFVHQLDRLPSLNALHIAGCGVQEIGSLSALKDLVHLDLSDNDIADISPLAELGKLRFVNLSGNRIADPSPLEGRVGITLIH